MWEIFARSSDPFPMLGNLFKVIICFLYFDPLIMLLFYDHD